MRREPLAIIFMIFICYSFLGLSIFILGVQKGVTIGERRSAGSGGQTSPPYDIEHVIPFLYSRPVIEDQSTRFETKTDNVLCLFRITIAHSYHVPGNQLGN